MILDITKDCISVETWITSAYITNYQLYGQKPSKPDGKDQEQDGADHGGEVEKENPEQDAREEAAGLLGVLSISMMVVGMLFLSVDLIKLLRFILIIIILRILTTCSFSVVEVEKKSQIVRKRKCIQQIQLKAIFKQI